MDTTIPVRDGEGFDEQVVESYLREHLPDASMPVGSLTVTQFAAGHSNLTYLLTCGTWKAVLRRPPLGPVAPKAHDMKREFELLKAISPYISTAPRPLLLCSDTDVLGAPFYVMDYLRGVVVDRDWPDSFPDTPEARRLASKALVEALAEMHGVGIGDPAMAAIGHPEGYMQRQVEGWVRRHELARTDEDIAEVSVVGKWLLDNMPRHTEATLIHNDFKFNNALLDPGNPGRIVGIVDWEMATLGDPLSDLAIMLSYWAEVGDPPVLSHGLAQVTTQPGFLTRSELMQHYARLTGRDLANMKFYLTFAYYKAAGICQQIYYRWWRGQTHDKRFEQLGPLATGLLKLAAGTALSNS